MKVKGVAFETERLIVRQVVPDCIPSWVQFLERNRNFHQPFMPNRGDIAFTDGFWQRTVQRDFELQNGLRFGMWHKETPELCIGSIHFANFVRGAFQACHLGYQVDEHHEGKGFMFEGLTASIDYMFSQQNFHRVMANYMPRNERSARLLQRLGFEKEGEAKHYLRICGVWEDHILTAKINPRWRELTPVS